MTGEAPAATYLGLVKHVPAIRWLWLGAAVSNFGDAVQGVALIWLVTRTSSPGLNIAIVAICLYLPTVIVGPVAGTVADRLSRRHLLIAADVSRIVTASVVPFAFTHIGLWPVYAVTVAHSAVGALFGAAQTAALPDVSGQESLVRANSLLYATNYSMGVVGAALGGLLAAATPLPVPFLVNGGTFAFSAAMMLVIRAAAMRTPSRPGSSTYLADLHAGARYARRHPPVRLYMLIGAIATVGFAPAPIALPVFATHELAAGSIGYGLLVSIGGTGYAVGSALTGRKVRPSQAANAMAAGYLAMGLATLALAAAPDLPVALLLVGLRTAFNAVLIVTGVSILQRMLPSEIRGRVFTLTNSVHELPRPFILPFAGILVDEVGARPVFAAMGTVIVVAGIIALRYREVLREAEPDVEVEEQHA